MKRFFLLLFILIIVFSPMQGYAWRCGSNVIEQGMRMYDVIEKCGEPKYKQVVGELILPENSSMVKTYVWEFVYKNGGFTRILTFHGSKLVKIEEEK